MKLWLSAVFLALASLPALTAGTTTLISVDEINSKLCTGVRFDSQTPIRAPFERGIVLETGWAPEAGLNRYIAVRHQLGFTFEGQFTSEGEIVLVLANLDEVNLKPGDQVETGTLLGTTRAASQLPDPVCRIFLLTKEPENPFLEAKTRAPGTVYCGWTYWNPEFLVR